MTLAWAQADYACGTYNASGGDFIKDALPVKLLCFVLYLYFEQCLYFYLCLLSEKYLYLLLY